MSELSALGSAAVVSGRQKLAGAPKGDPPLPFLWNDIKTIWRGHKPADDGYYHSYDWLIHPVLYPCVDESFIASTRPEERNLIEQGATEE